MKKITIPLISFALGFCAALAIASMTRKPHIPPVPLLLKSERSSFPVGHATEAK